MKKIYFLLILLPFFVIAQNEKQKIAIAAKSDIKALETISKKQEAFFKENRKLANKLAKQYNWPKEIKTKDDFSLLVGVSDGLKPIYYTTYNHGAGVTSRANKLYTSGGLGLNIQGENMTSAVWDAGAALLSHQLFSGRVQIMDNTVETHYHSTHVAGTIMGSDQFQNGAARGMAFKSNMQSYDWSNDLAEIAVAAANGLLLSNHSYGINPYFMEAYQWGKYNESAQTIDDIMFFAPYYQFVCAAGNSRNDFNTGKNGYDLISGHGVSKNGITVAAVNEVQDYTGPEAVVMSEFSSWGPTDDGRIKPDISAKGVNTFSAVDDSNTGYGILSGTSMASPSVSGTLLLLQQYYNQRNDAFMRAATLRGLMIHTADEAGANPGPDYAFGYGLINAEKAADVITKNGNQAYIQENNLQQGETFSLAVKAIGNEPLVATLSWTDPKGNIPDQTIDLNTPSLVNDLDIRITKGTDTFLPWKLDPAMPSAAATKSDNTVDNVEKQEIQNPSGNYVVTVSHKGVLLNNAQRYSLIISGNTVTDFWFTTNESTKSICQGSNSATIPFQLNTKSEFSGSVALSAFNLPNGVTAAFSPQLLSVSGSFVLTLNGLGQLALGNYQFSIKGQSASDEFEMNVTLKVLSSDFSRITPLLPANNAVGISNPVNFSWTGDAIAESYEIQIAATADFEPIIETATVLSNTYTASNLKNNNRYFWRVKSKNGCSSGNYSTPVSFITSCLALSDFTVLRSNSTTATISWTEQAAASSWQLRIVPQGNLPTGPEITAATNPFTATGLSSDTCYDVYVLLTCIDSAPVWTGPYTFCTQPDYCNGAHFYDTGGAANNYPDNEQKTTTIYPENVGERIKARFLNINLFDYLDSLEIYNGPNTNSQIIYASYWGNPPGTVVSNHESGALTFKFTSNGNTNSVGWDAEIICEPLPPCPYSPVQPFVTSLSATTATIAWYDYVNPVSWEVEIVLKDQVPTGTGTMTNTKPYPVTGLIKNTCYDFYIRSICANGPSSWTGPFSFCTTPDFCGGDHFYDTGGLLGNYQPNEYYQKQIFPSASGQRIRATFNSFDLGQECCDALEIYNGTPFNGNLLYRGTTGNMPPSVASTYYDGSLTFVFSSGYNSAAAGWDATIVCEPMPPCANPPTNIFADQIKSTSAILSWAENSNAVSWDVEIALRDAIPTGIGYRVTNNYYHSVTGLLKNTCYDVYVRSNCSDGSSTWTGPYQFCTIPDYCAGDHFYDNGGADGNYTPTNYNVTTIYPDHDGERIKAIFNTFSIEECCSGFSVYNGTNTFSPLLYSYSDQTPTPQTLAATYPSGALTFAFYSYGSAPRSGWDATIVCEPMPPCPNAPSQIGTYDITKTSAVIDWFENSGSNSWMVELVPTGTAPSGIGVATNRRPYQATGLLKNTCYDVYVKSVCANGPSDWTGPYKFCTLPDYCGGDHFYDSGGPTSNYLPNDYKVTVISPDNANDRVRAIFNSFNIANCCASMYIYNGPNTFSPLLYSSYENSIAPTTFASTDPSGALTFAFSSYSGLSLPGWDATIICEPMPPCVNPPTNVTLSNATTSAITVSWSENSAATQWEILKLPNGAFPTGPGTACNTNSFTFTDLALNSCQNIFVRSMCTDGPSLWVGPYTFCTQPDYCNGVHFYDTGGVSGNYQNGEHYVKTIFPETTGGKVKAIFNSLVLENCCDQLAVFNGPSDQGEVLFSYTQPKVFTSTHPTGALTFRFSSDGSSTGSGWDTTILCEAPTACSNDPISFTVSTVSTTTAVASWSYVQGISSWQVAIVPEGEVPHDQFYATTVNSFTFNGLMPGTCYYVYVRSVCSTGTSGWNGPVRICTTPDFCSGNHFYDTGGPFGTYQDAENYTTTIYPDQPDKKVNVVFNSFQLESCCDYLSIYNGPDNTFPRLSQSFGSNSPGSVTSTHSSGALTFAFYSDGSQTYSGWDATINCTTLANEEISGAFDHFDYAPNPVINALHIKTATRIKDYDIYSIEGRLLKRESASSLDFEINLSSLNTGSYLIRFTDENQNTKNIKVLKK